MTDLADIYAFVQRTSGMRNTELTPALDLERDLGITGDDFFELAQAFAKEFHVDMASYRWYFHHAEEVTFNPGALVFKPPYRRVDHIPVTPALLLHAANVRNWPVVYPKHSLPARRYDLLLNYALVAAGGVILAILSMRSRDGA
jgi:Protein of unknown function (DUF1493)